MRSVVYCVVIFLCLPVRVQSQIVLSEIMFDAVGSDSHDEFVEIVNLSDSRSVDLTGWQISDGVGVDNIVAVEAGFVLMPGQFAVILDASYFQNSTTYDTLIPETALILTIDNSTFGSRGFSNSVPETVSLLDSAGKVVSEYTYSLDNPAGFSDEKIILNGPNNPGNWQNSKTLFGTPGARNSVSPLDYDLSISSEDVTFVPAIIRENQEMSTAVKVHNDGIKTATNFKVSLFDDEDQNSVLDVNERLVQPFDFTGQLSPSDSIIVGFHLSGLNAGSHEIFAAIDFSADEDTTNNVTEKSLKIGFPSETVVVNEIMYSPLSGQPEWVEIYNRSASKVNLHEWALSDFDTTKRSFVQEDAFVEPGDYHVFSGTSTLPDFFDLPQEKFTALPAFPGLNNDKDDILIYDLTGQVIDRVGFNQSWGGETGVSLEKINPDISSNDSTNWSSSVAPEGGTPGRQNSIFTRIVPAGTSVAVSPNPFSPDGDGHEDFAVIQYKIPVRTAAINLKIYDLHGRFIRFLANNQESGSEGSVVWDGRDNNGQFVRIGIYVVFLQAIQSAGGILETHKQTVVVAGKL